jgi:hypothetical protein
MYFAKVEVLVDYGHCGGNSKKKTERYHPTQYFNTCSWSPNTVVCSYMGHLAGAMAGLMVGLVALENRKVQYSTTVK